MKVIAKINDDRVLCEVTIEELALLNGFRSQWDDEFKNQNFTRVGTDCNITKMASTSRYIRSMNQDTLIKAKEKLEDGIKVIDSVMDEITKLTIFEIIKESK